MTFFSIATTSMPWSGKIVKGWSKLDEFTRILSSPIGGEGSARMAAFAVMAGADAAAQYVEAIPLWIDIAATVAAFAAAFWITRWSSARARRRAGAILSPGNAS
jgi:hypothetical protein